MEVTCYKPQYSFSLSLVLPHLLPLQSVSSERARTTLLLSVPYGHAPETDIQ